MNRNHSRRQWILPFLFLIFFLTGCIQAGEDQGERFIKATVVKITDGDTIKVKINGKTESIRFLLINTPELGKQPKPYSEEAKNLTKKLLSENVVYLEKDTSERDKYGRLLMYIYTPDGKSVQEELLREGLAKVAYVYAPNTKYVNRYREIELDAKERSVGIWSDKTKQQSERTVEGNETESPTSKSNENCAGQIKGNQGSNGWVYHVPSGMYYDKTKAEQCFTTEESAKDAGYRKSSR
jgi:micrococcal nuclease